MDKPLLSTARLGEHGTAMLDEQFIVTLLDKVLLGLNDNLLLTVV